MCITTNRGHKQSDEKKIMVHKSEVDHKSAPKFTVLSF